MANEPRERIGGFQVLRRLAMGQTSEILLARADGPFGFERPVVLKRLLPHFRDDPAFGRMFAREATAYARLTHPAIVKLYDFFAGDGQLVMVLEHVDGVSLERLMTSLSTSAQFVDDRAALWVGWRVFTALAAAHAATDPVTEAPAPVVHRDVNPSNVLIPWDGHVKLGDFGVARVAGMGGDTQVGLVHGQFGYASPEQVKGDAVTPAADVYAAALVIWELLAKRRAFPRGSLPDVELLRTMSEPQLPPLDKLRPDLDPALRRALARSLSTDPNARTLGAEEMAGIIRASGRLEEGREVLVQSVAKIRRGDASGKIPPLFDEESITNAVASLRTMSTDKFAALSASAAAAATAGTSGARPITGAPPTPRASLTTDTGSPMFPSAAAPAPASSRPNAASHPANAHLTGARQVSQPAMSERSPVITSLMGWAETVPFEPGGHEGIPETLRGDIPAPVPFSSAAPALAVPGQTERASQPPVSSKNGFASALKSPSQPPAGEVLNAGSPSGNPPVNPADQKTPVPPPMETTPSKPPVDVHAAPTTFPGPFPGSLETTTEPQGIASAIASSLAHAAEATLADGDQGADTEISPPVQMDNPPMSQRSAESAGGIPATRHAPPKPLEPVPPPYVPPVVGFSGSMQSLPPPPQLVEQRARRSGMRVVVGIAFAGAVAAGAFFTWTHVMHGATASADPATTATATPAATPAATDDQSGGVPTGASAAATTASAMATAPATGSASASAPSGSAASPATSASAAVAAAASTSATSATSAAAALAASASAIVNAPPPGPTASTAQIRTSDKLAGHRVFVDGKVVGNSPGPIDAPCGKHRVKIGSSGAETTLDLKCGETTTIQ